MPDYEFEKAAVNSGFSCICGVDEAGRGPLAGPVCAAAVILPEGAVIAGLDDSKKLTEKKRERLYDIIKETAVAYSVAYGTLEDRNGKYIRSYISCNEPRNRGVKYKARFCLNRR